MALPAADAVSGCRGWRPYRRIRVVESERVFVFEDGSALLGFLRWGLFWDDMPFMNLVFVLPDHRGLGIGRALIRAWEDRCRTAGNQLVMTSTLANEKAQHFYRKLGYKDSGCLLLPNEALEIIFTKRLAESP